MKTLYELEYEEKERLLKEYISGALRMEFRIKSFIIGVICILFYTSITDRVSLFSRFAFIYLVVCIVDFAGIWFRYTLMKQYDEEGLIYDHLREATIFDATLTKVVGFNTLLYIIIDVVILKAFIYFML